MRRHGLRDARALLAGTIALGRGRERCGELHRRGLRLWWCGEDLMPLPAVAGAVAARLARRSEGEAGATGHHALQAGQAAALGRESEAGKEKQSHGYKF